MNVRRTSVSDASICRSRPFHNVFTPTAFRPWSANVNGRSRIDDGHFVNLLKNINGMRKAQRQLCHRRTGQSKLVFFIYRIASDIWSNDFNEIRDDGPVEWFKIANRVIQISSPPSWGSKPASQHFAENFQSDLNARYEPGHHEPDPQTVLSNSNRAEQTEYST